jgi:hypothetical protein
MHKGRYQYPKYRSRFLHAIEGILQMVLGMIFYLFGLR